MMNKLPLRVLHVLAELRPSGAETMLVAAAAQFRAAGVESEVLATGKTLGPYVERFAAAGYRIHHIPFSRDPMFFLKERQLMQRGGFDVIHLHCESANFWHALTALSARPRVVVQTIHAAFAFTGSLQWRRGWQRRLARRLGVRHVAISDSVRATELLHFSLPTTLVLNWYDSDRFVATPEVVRLAACKALAIEAGEFVIVSVGNCAEVKNHKAVIEAIAILAPERRPLYLHAGIEEPGHPEQALAQRLGVADRIRFLGGVNDIVPLLQAADAFVMPSLHEGFGIAAIEALATGLPALFSDVAGLKDFRADFPGLVYTGTSAESVAIGLEALFNLPKTQRAACRRDYPQIALSRFGLERGVREYVELYRSR